LDGHKGGGGESDFELLRVLETVSETVTKLEKSWDSSRASPLVALC
jgi:hypothetical protein